ncbi:MAG: uroporphyrinogen-III synthase [Bacteroidota bacterium]
MSSTILSTKVLSPSQKSLVINAGLRLVEYNAITVKRLDFELPKAHYDALIFTSQNAVKAYLEHLGKLPSTIKEGLGGMKEVFCVGKKTKSFLEENGFHVMASGQDAQELGKIISENHTGLHFLWPTGNQRRDELPRILNKEKIRFMEVTVYETVANPKKINTSFDGILFFSPSAVLSFTKNNPISGTAFCIGTTTADSVKEYTKNYSIATQPTVENVVVQAVKRFKGND